MISLKGGVKSYSDNAQPGLKGVNGEQKLSREELEKLGVDNVGELLNKISDSQWTDPSKELRAVGNNKLDKDAFLTLMLTQMKHQDPTNPMKSHEMAAQLAQFTSLEQLQNINTTLESMKQAQKPTNDFQALQFIGKVVSGDSSRIVRSEGDKEHEFVFDLPEAAEDVQIQVKNPLGETVRTYSLKSLGEGENQITWNGKSEQGVTAGAGEYSFVIDAKNALGKKLAIDTSFEGRISGMNYTASGPVLLIGKKSIKLKDVRKIIDPAIGQNDQIVKDVTAQDLSKPEQNKQTESGQKAVSPTGALMKNVGMDRGLINELKQVKE